MDTSKVETFYDEQSWLEARRAGIGASESAALVGVSPWQSPYSLYCQKLGLVDREEQSDSARERMLWGLRLQPHIVNRYRELVGRPVAEESAFTLLRSDRWPFLVATLDAVEATDSGDQPLEVKNVSEWMGRTWIETQSVPLYYQVQMQHQMAVTGATHASIAALVGGGQFIYAQDVPRDDQFIHGVLVPACETFWNQLRTQTPPDPDAHEATKSALKSLYPTAVEGSSIALPPEAIELDLQLVALKADIASLESRALQAENQLKALIADAETAILPNGVIYTYKTQARKETVVKASTFRVLRRKDAK